ncbi:MAG: quinone oxidoreductase family protein [Acidimicrobiales bacterium]
MHAIQARAAGGPDVLELVELDDPVPRPGTMVVKLAAAGLNFVDTYQRSGLYPMSYPAVLGMEGAGTVTAVADEVTGFSVGDRVAWSGTPGSYAEQVVVPADGAVTVPDGVGLEDAAAVMLQGMTAQFLVRSTFPLQPGNRCLIHAAAGGVGLLLVQMAKILGAEVFATVGTAEKAELATGAGADHVIRYRDVDFGDAIADLAGPRPIDVVYDGVGATTFRRSLDVIRPRGMMVTFGNASGPVEPVAPLVLSQAGSLFLTRPTLYDHIRTREELEQRSAEVFRWMDEGRLSIRIGDRFALADTRKAHEAIEGRATTGKVVLIP